MTSPTRSLRNLTFDELCQLFALNFGYQPDQIDTTIVVGSDDSSISDCRRWLSLDWTTGELKLSAIYDVQQVLAEGEDAIERLEQPLTDDKTNKIKDQLKGFNVAFL
ncbi:hypothetical protein [Spirosoma pomorum]